MSMEIELKLRLSAVQARRLVTHPTFADCAPRKFRLLNTYYDTADFALRERGIALRLRRKGWAVWLMTVKGGDSGAGGLAQRVEWEAPTQPGVFDFGVVTDDALRVFLEQHHDQLRPVFTTDFTRTTWTLARSGSVVELALDRGKVAALPAGDGAVPVSEPLCELELELLEGASPDALFELAIELASDLQLHPEILSKAERGFALAEGKLNAPVKAFSPGVDKAMPPVEAFRAIALSCLMQLQRNELGAIAGTNPEYVHQARVAIRRLRSALKLFAPVLNERFIEVYSKYWQELSSSLGSARDWDVFLSETLAPLEEAFPGDPDLAVLRARGEEKKIKAQAQASVALTQRVYSQLLLAFSAALFRVTPPTIEAQGGASALSLRKFAARRLGKRAKMIEQLVREHGKMNAERRHELRIAFKKLRYALEFFAPILPSKRLAKYQKSLETLQDLLGTLNDQVTASCLIKEIHPKGEPGPLTRGWIAGRIHLLLEALTAELRKFVAGRKPWL